MKIFYRKRKGKNNMKLKLFSRIQEFKQGNKTIKKRVYSTLMSLKVVGEEEKGAQKKYVNLKFREGIKTDYLKRGYIEIVDSPEYINYPFKYEIKDVKDDKGNVVLDANGKPKKEYPCVWIRKDDFKYTEVLKNNNQSLFDVTEEQDEEPNETPELPFNED